ncbi:ABC transporter permease [Cohnella terricola]|uniref:Transport permease protein n=1 Tax=Cohnella terricola TaxID=1289167 RepID=A0A559JAD4_9BACL|nr:ABC transporter permease [Cohnella terricola]TVX96844.1 ABC transporter permease [Cohnella terricola]
MKDVIWLMRRVLRGSLRRKSSWIVYIGLPLVGILISMTLYGNSTGGDLRVGIVNNDGDQVVTQDAIKFIEDLGQIKITLTDEASLREDIAASKLDSGLIFGQGFAAAIRNGDPIAGKVDIVSAKGAQVTAYIRSMLQNYVGNSAAIGRVTQGDASAFDKVYADYRENSFKLNATTIEDTTNMKDMTYQSIGFLVTFMMFSAVNLTELILREKENRTFNRLLSSPLSARSYVLSNVAVNIIILLLQIVLTVFLMKAVFHIDSGIPYTQLVFVLLLFALASIGLSLMIVAFAKSTKAAGAMQNLIITPTCLLSGCFFPMDIMPDSVKKISHFLPQHWLLDSINKLQHGESFGSLGLNFAILIGFAAAFALIAVYRFNRNNDARLFV